MDSTDLVRIIKKAAVEAVNASKPANVVFGKVISSNPLKIQIDQKLTIGVSQLIIPEHLTDHEVNIQIREDKKWETEESNEHTHDVVGNKKMIIKCALDIADKVILIQVAGGQKYVVIDRIGGD